jgi:hypothetical protein
MTLSEVLYQAVFDVLLVEFDQPSHTKVLLMADILTCFYCGETQELALCTICERPVCGRHRAGTGRLQDGYQCVEDRDCWAIHAQRVFPTIKRLAALRTRFQKLYFRLEDLGTEVGWDGILERLSAKLELLIMKEPGNQQWRYRAVEVKQKLGTLQFTQEDDTTPEMAAAIREAEHESTSTCEVCGAPGTTGRPRDPGPLRTLCSEHHEAARLGPERANGDPGIGFSV